MISLIWELLGSDSESKLTSCNGMPLRALKVGGLYAEEGPVPALRELKGLTGVDMTTGTMDVVAWPKHLPEENSCLVVSQSTPISLPANEHSTPSSIGMGGDPEPSLRTVSNITSGRATRIHSAIRVVEGSLSAVNDKHAVSFPGLVFLRLMITPGQMIVSRLVVFTNQRARTIVPSNTFRYQSQQPVSFDYQTR